MRRCRGCGESQGFGLSSPAESPQRPSHLQPRPDRFPLCIALCRDLRITTGFQLHGKGGGDPACVLGAVRARPERRPLPAAALGYPALFIHREWRCGRQCVHSPQGLCRGLPSLSEASGCSTSVHPLGAVWVRSRIATASISDSCVCRGPILLHGPPGRPPGHSARHCFRFVDFAPSHLWR